jgi:hypothetical protein
MPYQIEGVEKFQTPQKLLGFLKFLKNINDKIPSCLYFVVDVCFHLKGVVNGISFIFNKRLDILPAVLFKITLLSN